MSNPPASSPDRTTAVPGNTIATADPAGSASSPSQPALERMPPAVGAGPEGSGREQESEEWDALAAAIAAAEHDLALARATGDRHGEGLALVTLGDSAMLMGDGARAIGYYEEHLALTRAIGDRRAEATALDMLGNASYVLGQVEQAIDCLEQEIAIAHELGAHDDEARVSWNLGLTLEAQGAYAQAATLLQQCVDYAHTIDDPEAAAAAEVDAEYVEQVRLKAQAKAALPESLQHAIGPFDQTAFMAAWAGLTREEHARLRPLLDPLGLIYERLTNPALQAILAQLPESLRDPVLHAHEDAFLDVWATLSAAEQTRLQPLLESIGIEVVCGAT